MGLASIVVSPHALQPEFTRRVTGTALNNLLRIRVMAAMLLWLANE